MYTKSSDATARSIEIVEVSARDGLQNEARLLTTAQKIELIERMIAAGARRLEVANFVRADRVPQMADAEAVIAGLGTRDGITFIGLVMNMKGAVRALDTSIDELGAVCVASDAFAQRNQRQQSRESAQIAAEIIRFARANGRAAQATIGAAFGCPFSGEVDPAHVIDLAKILAEAAPREIAIADTIGVAVPGQVSDLVGRLRDAIGAIPIRVHLHNTRNTGIANAWAALEAGAVTLDASVGGIGGCPFAPAATGNIGTEDLLYMLDRSHIATGYDLGRTIDTALWLSTALERAVPAMLSRAGPFPIPASAG
jgi:hydroxymethylglutaryl-CoA lyase